MASYRTQRVAALIKEEVGRMILSGSIKDPRVDTMVIIADVEVSKDLAYAKLRVSSFEDRRVLDTAVEGLNSASGFIQARLSKRIRLRLTPRLSFVADHSIEDALRVTEKIKEAMS